MPLASCHVPIASCLLSCASCVLSCASCLLHLGLLPVTSCLMPFSYSPGLVPLATCLLHFALPVPLAYWLWPMASWMSPCNSCVVYLGSMASPLLRLDSGVVILAECLFTPPSCALQSTLCPLPCRSACSSCTLVLA